MVLSANSVNSLALAFAASNPRTSMYVILLFLISEFLFFHKTSSG